VICSGREEHVLLRLAAGEAIGSQLVVRQAPLAARRQWLADHLQLRGGVVLDAGAVRALREEGKSLLPVGVKGVTGEFERGEVVAIVDDEGREVARGLTNHTAQARRAASPASRAARSRPNSATWTSRS
jgi:glutamate 5-kinase